jgi:hypothetical protein
MKRYALRIVLIVLSLAVVVSGAAIAWSLRTQTSSFYTDGGAIREKLANAPVRDILWEPPVAVRWTDSPSHEFEPHVSRDGQQLLLVRGQAGRNADLYIAQREGDGWTQPVALDAINSEADELGPALSADGSTLYFYSNRAGGQGGYDLWMAAREGDRFGLAENLGTSINSPFDDYGAAPMMDGSGVVFASNRPDADAVVRIDSEGNEIVEAGDYDLYIVARSEDGSFGEARPIDDLNTPATEGAPEIATRGDFLYFASDRPGGHGGFDLYRARIFDGVVYDPQNLDGPVNTAADELDPAITAEGFGLLFSSNRDAAAGSTLYFSASREVFVHDETLRGEIDWESVWDWLWPYLLALLLLLLVLLLIPLLAKAIFGDRERLGPASLLLKCLFASVFVHFLLVLLLTVWVVATGLPEHLRPGRGTRVVLTSPSVSSGAAAQVTGRLSESASVDAPTMASERLQQAVAMARRAMRVEVMPNTEPVMPTSSSVTSEVTDAADTPASVAAITVSEAAPPRSSEADIALRDMPAAERERSAESTAVAEPSLKARDTPAEMLSEAFEAAMSGISVVETSAESARERVQAESREASAARVSDADAQVEAPALTTSAESSEVTAATSALAVDLPVDSAVHTERETMDGATVAAESEALPRYDTAEAAAMQDVGVRLTDIAPAQAVVDSSAFMPRAEATVRDAASTSAQEAAPSDAALRAAETLTSATSTVRVAMPTAVEAINVGEGRAEASAAQMTMTESARSVTTTGVDGASAAIAAMAPAPSSATTESERTSMASATSAKTSPAPAVEFALTNESVSRDDIAVALTTPIDAVNDAANESAMQISNEAMAMTGTKASQTPTDAVNEPGRPMLATVSPSTTDVPDAALPMGTSMRDAEVASTNEIDVQMPSDLVISAATVDVRRPDAGSGRAMASVEPAASDAFTPAVGDMANRPATMNFDTPTAGTTTVVSAAPPSSAAPASSSSLVVPDAQDRTADMASTLAPLTDASAMVAGPAPTFAVSMPTDRGTQDAATDGSAERIAEALIEAGTERANASTMVAADVSAITVTVAPVEGAAGAVDARESLTSRSRIDDAPAFIDLPVGTTDDLIDVDMPMPIDLALRTEPGTGATSGTAEAQTLAIEEGVFAPMSTMTAPPAISTNRSAMSPFTVMSPESSSDIDGSSEREFVREIGDAAPAPLQVMPNPVRTVRIEPMTAISPSLNFAADSAPAPPVRTAKSEEPYAQRAPEIREQVLEEMGGSRETEEAVRLALEWLASRQQPDGRWDGKNFGPNGEVGRGAARAKVDTAVTGLALLCFLAADHTHTKDGPYRETVGDALSWLVAQQESDGSLIGRESMYSHGIASIALAEAYGMTKDPALRDAVQDAVDFIYDARNLTTGGWRYAPGQVGDTSVLGWQIMAITSARRAGVDVPDAAFDVGRAWLELVTDRRQPGLYTYRPGRASSPAMTAESMFVHQLLGSDPAAVRMAQSTDYLLQNVPESDRNQSTYYWYYGTLAMFQYGGDAWKSWNEDVKNVLVNSQHTRGIDAGSWDPDDKWAQVGGRVYQTAISTLTLEVYYRYLPLYLSDPDADPEAERNADPHAEPAAVE